MGTEPAVITGFLEARISEDEAAAREAASWTDSPHWQSEDDPTTVRELFGGEQDVLRSAWGDDGGLCGPVALAARFDPARVLAECAAKRAIIEAHRDGSAYCDRCSHGGINGGDCPTIHAIASVYADHQDFDPAWGTT